MTADLHDLAAPYALDALDPSERGAFEAHLGTCADCRGAVAALQEGAAHLAALSAVPPPPGMRKRVLAEVTVTPQERDVIALAGRRRPGLPTRILTSVAALVLLLAVVALGVNLLSDPTTAADVLAAADLVNSELTATPDYEGGPVEATVSFSPGKGAAVVTFAGLEEVDPSLTYELWVIGAGEPRPAGLFRPGGDGRAQELVDEEVVPGVTIAVTIEPAEGVDSPTGPIVFAGSV